MVILNRKKNQETFAELNILNTKSFCTSEINKLTASNYYKGPTPDTENKGDYWEFGTVINDKEIYIKINYGLTNKSCLLISFHFAEFRITYPFA